MNRTPQPMTGTGRTQQQRWMRLGVKILLVTAISGAILALSTGLMQFAPGMPWRALVALLPMLALGLFLWVFIGAIRSTDERIQRIESRALGIAAIAVASLWYAAGLLQSAEVIDLPASQALFLVLPAMFLAYGIVKAVLMLCDFGGGE